MPSGGHRPGKNDRPCAPGCECAKHSNHASGASYLSDAASRPLPRLRCECARPMPNDGECVKCGHSVTG